MATTQNAAADQPHGQTALPSPGRPLRDLQDRAPCRLGPPSDPTDWEHWLATTQGDRRRLGHSHIGRRCTPFHPPRLQPRQPATRACSSRMPGDWHVGFLRGPGVARHRAYLAKALVGRNRSRNERIATRRKLAAGGGLAAASKHRRAHRGSHRRASPESRFWLLIRPVYRDDGPRSSRDDQYPQRRLPREGVHCSSRRTRWIGRSPGRIFANDGCGERDAINENDDASDASILALQIGRKRCPQQLPDAGWVGDPNRKRGELPGVLEADDGSRTCDLRLGKPSPQWRGVTRGRGSPVMTGFCRDRGCLSGVQCGGVCLHFVRTRRAQRPPRTTCVNAALAS
jgi:hypothetical protein